MPLFRVRPGFSVINGEGTTIGGGQTVNLTLEQALRYLHVLEDAGDNSVPEGFFEGEFRRPTRTVTSGEGASSTAEIALGETIGGLGSNAALSALLAQLVQTDNSLDSRISNLSSPLAAGLTLGEAVGTFGAAATLAAVITALQQDDSDLATSIVGLSQSNADLQAAIDAIGVPAATQIELGQNIGGLTANDVLTALLAQLLQADTDLQNNIDAVSTPDAGAIELGQDINGSPANTTLAQYLVNLVSEGAANATQLLLGQPLGGLAADSMLSELIEQLVQVDGILSTAIANLPTDATQLTLGRSLGGLTEDSELSELLEQLIQADGTLAGAIATLRLSELVLNDSANERIVFISPEEQSYLDLDAPLIIGGRLPIGPIENTVRTQFQGETQFVLPPLLPAYSTTDLEAIAPSNTAIAIDRDLQRIRVFLGGQWVSFLSDPAEAGTPVEEAQPEIPDGSELVFSTVGVGEIDGLDILTFYQDVDGSVVQAAASDEITAVNGRLDFIREAPRRLAQVQIGSVLGERQNVQLRGNCTFDLVPTFTGHAATLNNGATTIGLLRFDNNELFLAGDPGNNRHTIVAGENIPYVIDLERIEGDINVSGEVGGVTIPSHTISDFGNTDAHALRIGAQGGVPAFRHTISHTNVQVLSSGDAIAPPDPTPPATGNNIPGGATVAFDGRGRNSINNLGFAIQYQDKGTNVPITSTPEPGTPPLRATNGRFDFEREDPRRRLEINFAAILDEGFYSQMRGEVSFDVVPTFPGYVYQTKYEFSLGIGGNTIGSLRFQNRQLFILGSNARLNIQPNVRYPYVINFARINGRFLVSGVVGNQTIQQFSANDNGQSSIAHVLKMGAYGGAPSFRHTVSHFDPVLLIHNQPIPNP